MSTNAKALLIMMVISIGLISAATAAIDDNDKPIISLTPYLGGGFWSDDLGLDESLVYGARGALHFTKRLSLEGTYGRSPADRSLDGMGVDLDRYGLGLVLDLMPDSRFSPFLTGGWAQIDYNADDASRTQVLNGPEAGIGLKARLGDGKASYRALRVELRDVVSNLTPAFPNNDDATHNLIASVGLQFAFGRSSHDSDFDGVRDRSDDCADTPRGARIDENGCPIDSDGDGVFDGLDKCEGTLPGAWVDASGCPTDSDNDGVFDGLDKCEGTPTGAIVDSFGCTTDSDMDGVYDGLDKCPDTASNLQVDRDGCPITITETETQLMNTGGITTSKIVFASGSAEIDLEHSGVLEEIGETLSHWPELKMEIIGHTDDTGSAAFNQALSQKRAQAVLDHLTANYPEANTAQYLAVGKGEADPIADNKTVEGRQANRRVEFKVLNPEELKRVIEHRKLLER
jgi:OmpA-OmpF porin, OOP family